MINFMVYDEAKNVTNAVAYDGDETIEAFLKKYVKDHADFLSLDTRIYVFKNGLKILNSNKFLSEKIKNHIGNNCTISFIRKKSLSYWPQLMSSVLKEKQNDRNFGYYIDYFNNEQKNPSEWKAIIEGPKGSIYEGGFYMLKIIFPSEYYPFPNESKLTIYFINKIFHPHIFKGLSWHGNCCVIISKTDIESILEAVENMLINYNANIEYAYNEEPRSLLLDKKEDKFIEKAKSWVQEFAKFKHILKYLYM